MHSATNPDAKSLRADFHSGIEYQQHIQTHINDGVQGDEAQQPKMPIIDPEELVGKALSVTQEDGETTRIKVIEAISDHHNVNSMSNPTVKSRCSISNVEYEKVLCYNQIFEYLAKNDIDIVWKFKEIIGHQGPLSQNHKNYKGSMYNMTILWENGETSLEPLSLIAADDPVSCAIYARKTFSPIFQDGKGWKD